MHIDAEEWSEIKYFIDNSTPCHVAYGERDKYYVIVVCNDIVHLQYKLDRNPSDNTNLLDFENNYKSGAARIF